MGGANLQPDVHNVGACTFVEKLIAKIRNINIQCNKNGIYST